MNLKACIFGLSGQTFHGKISVPQVIGSDLLTGNDDCQIQGYIFGVFIITLESGIFAGTPEAAALAKLPGLPFRK